LASVGVRECKVKSGAGEPGFNGMDDSPFKYLSLRRKHQLQLLRRLRTKSDVNVLS
jgi:hypothetical protein